MLKLFHIGFVYLSIGGFILRGVWLLSDAKWFRHRITKILPHINDTLLLGTGITLAVTYSFNPIYVPWLSAKLIALCVYIGLGIIAFKVAKRKWTQAFWWLAAIAAFAYMMITAITKSHTLGF